MQAIPPAPRMPMAAGPTWVPTADPTHGESRPNVVGRRRVLAACVGGADADDDEDRDSGGDSGLVVQGDGRLFINEFMASNRSLAIDPDDPEATSDWVEIFNASLFDVDLTGFTITDDLEQPEKAVLGSLVVPAGGHLVLLADGGDGGIHLPFKLSMQMEMTWASTPRTGPHSIN